MTKKDYFPVTITQSYRAWRRITVFVDAPDQAAAVEKVQNDEFTIPEFEHSDWTTEWELQGEEAKAGD